MGTSDNILSGGDMVLSAYIAVLKLEAWFRIFVILLILKKLSGYRSLFAA